MDTYKKSLIPERIKEARVARGLSQQQLADKINVTRQSISQFELGTITPKPEVFRDMAVVLNFPKIFFTLERDFKNSQLRSATFFRSLKSVNRDSREMMKIRIDWIEHSVDYLEKFLNFPKIDLQKFLEIDELTVNDEDKIENVTNNLRNYWDLGIGPIANLTNFLEKRGFIVTFINNEYDKIDSFSEIRNGKPFIFLNKYNRSATRVRFDLAHELAHLLLHNYINGEELNDRSILNKIEKEANLFAGAFLFPRDSAISDINSTSINHLIALKEKWKISIAAIVCRAEGLNIFNDNQILSLNKQISYRKWRKKEPLDEEIKIEEPLAMKQAINLLIDNNIKTPYEILNDLPYGREELESLFNLEKNTLSISDNVIDLSLKRDSILKVV